MRSRTRFVYVLVVGVGIGLLMTGPVDAQSVNIGNALINVLDAQGDTVFHVSTTNDVVIGGTGADIDLTAYESTGDQTLWFNTSLADFYIGGPDSDGTIYLRDTGNVVNFYASANGDVALGSSADDGDLTIREGTTAITNMTVDGNTATLTLGAHGVAGDPGTMYFRDTNGTTNNIYFQGMYGEAFFGSTVTSDDGDISLSDGSTTNFAIDLEGSNGTITNKTTGNGLVKAWAQINSDGTVRSCWRCSTSASNTQEIVTGQYEVDFTFDTDISARPVACSLGHNGVGGASGRGIYCAIRSGDPSSIFVFTTNASGTTVSSEFTAVVF